MKVRMARIGNSWVVRIPRTLIDQAGLGEDVGINVQGELAIVGPPRRARQGWAVAFQAMARRGDDALPGAGSLPPTRWEREEWEW